MVKIERTFPAPKSLAIESKKINGSYTEIDVIEQLRKDFHDKCYICEINHLQDPQVEHLLPHKNRKYQERVFDWNNLFLSCSHCNNVKNQQKYDIGIIDCCKEDPEELLYFKLEKGNVNVCGKNQENQNAVLTAELITEVFNLKNTGMRIYKSEMRFLELNKEMNKLYDTIEEMKENPNSKVVLRKLKALLRKESKFAAFKRSYIRENKENYPQLLEYLCD